MDKHTVVRIDDMDFNRVVSLKYNNGSAFAAIDNGMVVKLDSLIEGEREIYKAVTPTGKEKLDQIAFVATPEVMYDERIKNLDGFYNEADRTARGYVMNHGCYLSVTKDGIEGDAAVGSVVELQAGNKLKAVATATSGMTQVGRVVAIETVGTYEFVVIRVEA